VIQSFAMERTYDVFEKFADGTMLWRATVVGHEDAIRKLRELAEAGANEFCLMHLGTQTVIATMKPLQQQT
jgi:hypothetical protein